MTLLSVKNHSQVTLAQFADKAFCFRRSPVELLQLKDRHLSNIRKYKKHVLGKLIEEMGLGKMIESGFRAAMKFSQEQLYKAPAVAYRSVRRLRTKEIYFSSTSISPMS